MCIVHIVTEENSAHRRRDRSAQISFFLQYRNLNRFYDRYTHPAILKLLKNTQIFRKFYTQHVGKDLKTKIFLNKLDI